MAVREVLRYPHRALKQVARPLDLGDPEPVERLARDLIETMRAHPGCVGLAAPQIGELVRLIVVDVSGHRSRPASNGILVLANPRLVTIAGAEVAREGCLSIPEFTANVRRGIEVVVEGFTPAGDARTVDSV